MRHVLQYKLLTWIIQIIIALDANILEILRIPEKSKCGEMNVFKSGSIDSHQKYIQT